MSLYIYSIAKLNVRIALLKTELSSMHVTCTIGCGIYSVYETNNTVPLLVYTCVLKQQVSSSRIVIGKTYCIHNNIGDRGTNLLPLKLQLNYNNRHAKVGNIDTSSHALHVRCLPF